MRFDEEFDKMIRDWDLFKPTVDKYSMSTVSYNGQIWVDRKEGSLWRLSSRDDNK